MVIYLFTHMHVHRYFLLYAVCLIDRLTVSYSRSSGPGGQHVNKGIIITIHIPVPATWTRGRSNIVNENPGHSNYYMLHMV